MNHTRVTSVAASPWTVFEEPETVMHAPAIISSRPKRHLAVVRDQAPVNRLPDGHIKTTALSFTNMHQHGDLLLSYMRTRKSIFVDRLNWNVPEAEDIEFDQYDTPLCRWIAVHEFGEVIGGIRLTPTTAKMGVYSYMLRDAQHGKIEDIPTDVLFFDAPVKKNILEASRLFISDAVPAARRLQLHTRLVRQMRQTAIDQGADWLIGIVPAVWSRWMRRIGADAIPVGPKFSIDGTTSQAVLFNLRKQII
jgi:acyl homoserine lactone synthase